MLHDFRQPSVWVAIFLGEFPLDQVVQLRHDDVDLSAGVRCEERSQCAATSCHGVEHERANALKYVDNFVDGSFLNVEETTVRGIH